MHAPRGRPARLCTKPPLRPPLASYPSIPTPCAFVSLPLWPFQVLDQVPWVAPKPLYLLTVEQAPPADAPGAAAGAPPAGLSYSLRTRVVRADTEDELSRVLRRRAADGGPLIRCSEMKDGVVAFEDEADAERYGQLLEADGTAQVGCATIFRGLVFGGACWEKACTSSFIVIHVWDLLDLKAFTFP